MLVDLGDNLVVGRGSKDKPQVPMHTAAVDRVHRGCIGFDALSQLFEAGVRRDATDFGWNVGEGLDEFLG